MVLRGVGADRFRAGGLARHLFLGLLLRLEDRNRDGDLAFVLVPVMGLAGSIVAEPLVTTKLPSGGILIGVKGVELGYRICGAPGRIRTCHRLIRDPRSYVPTRIDTCEYLRALQDFRSLRAFDSSAVNRLVPARLQYIRWLSEKTAPRWSDYRWAQMFRAKKPTRRSRTAGAEGSFRCPAAKP